MQRGVREAANAYLEGLTQANEALMREGRYPALYSSGVGYSMGDVTTLPLVQTVQHRKRAACGPLAAYRAAELRRAGDAGAVALVRPSRSGIPGRWHAVVVRGDGHVEDPSAVLKGEEEVVGWGLPSIVKKVAGAAKKVVRTVTKPAAPVIEQMQKARYAIIKQLEKSNVPLIKQAAQIRLKLREKGIPVDMFDAVEIATGKKPMPGLPGEKKKTPPTGARPRAKAVFKPEGIAPQPPGLGLAKPRIDRGVDENGAYAAVTIPIGGARITVVRRGDIALEEALLRARQIVRDPGVAPYVDRRATLAIDAAAAASVTGDVPTVLGALGRAAEGLPYSDTRYLRDIGRSLPAVVRACQ